MTAKQIFKTICYRTLALLFFFLAVLHAENYAEHPVIRFKHMDRMEGLRNSYIRSLYQDRKGFMLIGTKDGLHVYDGNRVTVYAYDPENPNSFPDKKVKAIIEDPDSSFVYWIGTNNGLSRFDMVRNKYRNFFKKEDITKYKKPPGSISCLFVDSYGNIWIGFNFNGLKKYDTTTRTFISFKNNPKDAQSLSHDLVSEIFEDDDSNLWVLTVEGTLNKYQPGSGTFKRYDIDIPETLKTKRRIKTHRVRAACRGKNNILWISFYRGVVCRYDLSNGKYSFIDNFNLDLQAHQNIEIASLLEDHTGTLWAATRSRGLIQYDPKTGESIVHRPDKQNASSISSSRLYLLYEDKNGNLWVGTSDNGLDWFPLPQKGFHNKEFFKSTLQYMDRSRIFAVLQDEDSLLWLGFLNGGLLRYDLKSGHSKYYAGRNKTDKYYGLYRITSIIEDSTGYLWIGTVNHGLHLFDKKNERLKSPVDLNPDFKILTRSTVFSLYEDKDGDIWIGTSKRGVFHYDRYNNRIKRYSHVKEDSLTIADNLIRCILQDSDGYIWVGSLGGLDKLDKYSQKIIENIRVLKFNSNYPVGKVNSLYEDVNKNLWIGSSNGLIRFNPRTKEAVIFNEAGKFPSNRIVGILADAQNNLWISTYKGLVYLNTTHNTFITYTIKDGLQDHRFSNNAFFRSPEGVMYFGHHEGLTYFRPEEIEYGRRVPEVVITDIRTESNPFSSSHEQQHRAMVTRDSRLEFPWSNHTFYIEFAVLDYTDPQKNQYAYKVEGLDKDWHFLKNRNFLSLINIPPGEYPIRIAGASARGVWNEKGILLHLVVLPPFWQTWWFRALMGVMVILIAYLIFYIRTKQVKKRNRELEQINTRLNEQISVRKHVENMLRLSEEKYRRLVSSIEHYIVACDGNGTITFINEVMARALGDNAENMIGKSLVPLMPEAEREDFKQKVEYVIATNESLEYDVEINSDPEKQYYHVHMQPLKENDDITRQVLVVAADVTQQKNLEDQLRQSQKMEAIGKLAGGIAHDFNNLIAIIRGYSDIILSEMEQENELYESILEIDKAGERAAALVRQLLAFSRRQILQPKVIDVNLLIRDMEKMLNRLIRENIELWFRLDPDLGNIYADPGQIEQVIMNLVLNARDAMPKGGKISIETKSITERDAIFKKNHFMAPAEYVLIEVRDTGTGIKKELQTKIFDPFFTTKRKGEGTGLGLSTVFGIVKQSKGYILLESEEGKGTSFKIYLPKVNDVISFARQTIRLNNNLQGTETILVVEDEQSLRTMICKMLSANGYKVVEAADGLEALSLINESDEEIDLLLTDVVMPGMSGRDLAERITAQRPGIAVLYMSGYTDDEIVHQGVLFPETHFIQKPFTPEALGRKIRDTLKSAKKRKTARAAK